MTKTMNLTRRIITLSIAIVSVLAVAAYSQQVDAKADKAALDNITKISMQAFNEGNLEKYVALIADDAVWIPLEGSTLFGKDAIQKWYEAVFPSYQFNVNFTTESTEIHGEFAFQYQVYKGIVTPKQGGGSLHLNNRALVVLRKQADGTWKIWKSIWNRNQEEKDTEN
jgi:uncharacterized protein (TIGR02246 family)